jgi:ligand-binding SRPBCC domain-containing protein
MHLLLTFKVQANLETVKAGFNASLFTALSPPFPKVDLVHFGGSSTGDKVHVRLHLPLFGAQDWISDITADSFTTQKWQFTDQGVKLPFFLGYWQHQHIVEQHNGYSTITEDITFKGPWWLPDFLLYPTLYLQFSARKPVYQKIFGAVKD